MKIIKNRIDLIIDKECLSLTKIFLFKVTEIMQTKKNYRSKTKCNSVVLSALND